MIVKTVIAVLEIKDVFFLLFFFFIALHQILCHFLSYRSYYKRNPLFAQPQTGRRKNFKILSAV